MICWIEAHQGLAAWVQAIGSVVALIAAFVVVFVQHYLSTRDQRLRDTATDRAVLNALLKTAQDFEAELEFASGVLEAFEWDEIARSATRFRKYDAILSALPAERLIMADVMFQWLFLKQTASVCAEHFTVVRLDTQTMVEADTDEVAEYLIECQKAIVKIEQTLTRFK